MAVSVVTNDPSALTDGDLDEMGSMEGAFDIGAISKAKDDWVPMFQRDATTGTTNGHGVEALPGESLSGAATANVQEGAAAGGAASADAAEAAATETADAINDAYDGVDREPSA